MQDEPCHDDTDDLREHNVHELLVRGDRRSLRAIKRDIARGVPGATPNTTVCRDWRDSLHVSYGATGGAGIPAAASLALRWREAHFVLAFDFRDRGCGGCAHWKEGALTAIEYDDAPYQGEEPYADYLTVGHPGDGPGRATMTPPRLASLCLLARCYGWRPDDPLLRALDASLDPIDAGRLEGSPELKFVVATLPAEEAARLAAALALARGCLGVPVEILTGLGIRGDAPPGGAYDTGRAGGSAKRTLRTIREVHGLASAGVELVVTRTVLSRPATD